VSKFSVCLPEAEAATLTAGLAFDVEGAERAVGGRAEKT